jgi:membrane fusion protein, multidrug efflux system
VRHVMVRFLIVIGIFLVPIGAAANTVSGSPGAGVAQSAEGAIHVVRALIMASRSARISSQMNGRIQALPLKTGDPFRAGDILVEFDCDSQRAQLAAARAELAKASTALASRESLVLLEAVSELDVALARSEVEYAQAGVAMAQALLGHCRVRAPYAGRVVSVEANQFETMSPGQSLIEIVETGELFLEVLVPSRWLRWLKEGQVFEVLVDELGQEVNAQVVALGARVDPVSQTISVRAKIVGNQQNLKPGMSGDARFKVPAP